MKTIIVIILLLIAFTGCSGAEPTLPNNTNELRGSQTVDNRWNWGYWSVYISADHTKVEAVPQRYTDFHFCVTQFVEANPCSNCLSIGKPHIQADGSVKLNVTLRHPFPTLPRYTGFDVRGMVYLPPTQSHDADLDYRAGDFPYADLPFLPTFGDKLPLSFSRTKDGGGELLNPDGYSCYLIPGASYSQDWPVFNYQPGKCGVEPTPQFTTVNPYRLFASDSERRMFLTSDIITREYHFVLPPSEFCFGYAVDASWWPPSKVPITNPATDFPLYANAEDPWLIEYEQLLPIKEENIGKDIFKVTIHHRGTDHPWGGYIFSWGVSSYDAYYEKYPLFDSAAFVQIDDFTTCLYFPLLQNWWYLYAESAKLFPGHHLGVLVVSTGNALLNTELEFVYGVRFVDIYIEE